MSIFIYASNYLKLKQKYQILRSEYQQLEEELHQLNEKLPTWLQISLETDKETQNALHNNRVKYE